jgi:hypothetical protein
LLLSCGGEPPAPAAPPSRVLSSGAGFSGWSGDPSGGGVRPTCAAADCNELDGRKDYVDPAAPAVQEDRAGNPVNSTNKR